MPAKLSAWLVPKCMSVRDCRAYITLLASSSSVLRECADETLRALRLSARTGVALGRAGVHRGHRPDRLSRRDRARPVRAADAARDRALVAGSPCICPNMPHAPRSACWRRCSSRWCSRSPMRPGRPRASAPAGLLVPILDILQSVPISGFHFDHQRVLPVAGAGRVLGARIRGDLRHLHQPGLEHGVQLLPVAAHRADASSSRRPSRSGCRRGCGSGSWRCRSPCRRWSGT